MALSFPSSPTLNQTTTTGGQTWTWNGNNWYVSTSSGGGASVTVANSAPNSPADGSLWLNSDSGVFSVFYNTSNVWLGFVGGGSSGGGTSLPSFTGNTGKFLTNDGTVSSWGNVTIPSVTASAVSDQLNTSTGYFSLPTGNTAQRPGTPVTGATRINSQTNYFETYYNSNWFNLTYIGLITATSANATVTYSGNYAIHTFLTSGSFTPMSVPVGGTIEYLVVAGGGGGAGAGAGGAGGYLSSIGYGVTAGTNITITVGAGGAGTSVDGVNGINSSMTGNGITPVISIGGGKGSRSGDSGSGGVGGSGGGNIWGASYTVPSTGGAGTVGQGNAGGGGINSSLAGAGGAGGGAGAAGGNAGPVSSYPVGGLGGVGLASSITGNSIYYAGGGGGGSYVSSPAGNGGNGGGGGGASGSSTQGLGGSNGGSNGTSSGGGAGGANSGGGGGGGPYTSVYVTGGNGGSGIVIIRYRYQ